MRAGGNEVRRGDEESVDGVNNAIGKFEVLDVRGLEKLVGGDPRMRRE